MSTPQALTPMQKLKHYTLALMAVMVIVHTIGFVVVVTEVRAQKTSVIDLVSVGEPCASLYRPQASKHSRKVSRRLVQAVLLTSAEAHTACGGESTARTRTRSAHTCSCT